MKKATIIAVTLFAAGAVCCFAAVGMGASNGSLKEGLSSLRAAQYQEKAEDKGFNTQTPVEQVVLDIDSAECIVQTGTANSLTGGSDVKWKMDGNTLTVSQQTRNGWWWRSRPAKITLTLAESELSSLDIDMDAGTITVQDLTVTQMTQCSIDAGAVEMHGMCTNALELDVDAGGIVFSGQTLGPIQLDCDAGGIELELENSSIGHVTGEVDAGEINVKVNGKQALKHNGFEETVSTDLPGATGNDVLTFDCDAGSISVELTTQKAG